MALTGVLGAVTAYGLSLAGGSYFWNRRRRGWDSFARRAVAEDMQEAPGRRGPACRACHPFTLTGAGARLENLYQAASAESARPTDSFGDEKPT